MPLDAASVTEAVLAAERQPAPARPAAVEGVVR
jgi:hypothetical protein